MAEPRELSFHRDERQALEVRLAGVWTKAEGLPPADELRRAIEVPAPPSRVSFDARGVQRWDSALVAVVDRLVELARERKVPVVLDGLPAGVVRVSGRFDRGDAVVVRDGSGLEIARGLTAYSSADAERICGRRSAELERLLGYRGRDEMIHRDDLVLS